MQRLRGMAELARCLGTAPEGLVVGLFKHMKRGWEQLFYCVAVALGMVHHALLNYISWLKSEASKQQSAHKAACFAHSVLVELVGRLGVKAVVHSGGWTSASDRWQEAEVGGR